jgi:hypothetical protein
VDFVQEVVRQLHLRELPRVRKRGRLLFHFPDFLRRMHMMHGGRITIMLDEADQLVKWERNEWEIASTLRASVSAGHCRYILAGFKDLMNELYNSNSPFFMAFEPVRLGPFDRKDTEDVILRPMRSLRMRFVDEAEVVTRIHSNTRGHPLLVQYYCKKLIDQLEHRSHRTFSPANLTDIDKSDGLKALVIHAFRDNVSKQDKALVYALLHQFPKDKDTFSPGEMYGALQKEGCPSSPEKIDRSCERLVLAGILVREGSRHGFSSPIFPRILRANYDLDHLLSVAKKEMGL